MYVLCAAGVGMCLRSGGGLRHARYVGALPEIVVLRQTVCAQLHFVYTTLNQCLVLAAQTTKFRPALLAEACADRHALCPVPRLHIHATGCQNHSRREQNASCGQHFDVFVQTKRSRQKTQAGDGKKASSSNQPASNLQRHSTLFLGRNPGRASPRGPGNSGRRLGQIPARPKLICRLRETPDDRSFL